MKKYEIDTKVDANTRFSFLYLLNVFYRLCLRPNNIHLIFIFQIFMFLNPDVAYTSSWSSCVSIKIRRIQQK